MVRRLVFPLFLLLMVAATALNATRHSAVGGVLTAGSLHPRLINSSIHDRSLREITVGMGYVPNVQFAPFYLAQSRGYYRQEGLHVVFDYASSPNLLQLVGAGNVDVANADGTDVMAAAAHGVPVTQIAAEYQRFPVAIFALARDHFRRLSDLKGHTIGVPGLYGATYVGLLAALHHAGLRPSDVHIQSIGYTQVESVADGAVDAAVGYSTNEPLRLAERGYRVTTFQVADTVDLIGPGLVAGDQLIRQNPDVLRRFVRATLRGLGATLQDPAAAFAAAREQPGLHVQGRDATDQKRVLLHTLPFWHSLLTHRHGLGYASPAQWQESARLLSETGSLSRRTSFRLPFTNRFIVGTPRL